MKDELFRHLVSKLGISKSTVSKAMRHCSGVDSETRAKILSELKTLNYRSEKYCDVYCILPDVPQYFWGRIRQGLEENVSEAVRFKLNIYTRLVDEDAILYYLDEAEAIGAPVIIISAIITEKIRRRLESLLPSAFIIHLTELEQITNSFYIGANPFDDGYVMGKLFQSHCSGKRVALIEHPGDRNAAMRLDGFRSALSEGGVFKETVLLQLNNETYFDKIAASRLATRLAPYANQIDCIYSPIGIIQLPLALKKAGFSEETMILCHDTFAVSHDDAPIAGVNIVMNQNVYAQGKAAIAAAEHFLRTGCYPCKKYTYIPSVLCC